MSSVIQRTPRRRRALLAVATITAVVFGSVLSATAANADPITNNTAPAITGVSTVGGTLKVTTAATWDVTPDSITYIWSDGTNTDLLDYAHTFNSTDTYVVPAEEIGKSIFVIATARSGADSSTPVTSNSLGPVAASSVSVVTAPTLSGDAVVGGTYTATPGTYTGAGVVVSYSWAWAHPDDPVYGGGRSDDGIGTGPTYTVIDSEIGTSIGVMVTATATNGDTVSTVLSSSDLVKPAAPVATDAGLTAANQGGVTGGVAGTTATITLSTLSEGDEVFVYGYSTPTPLGFFYVNASNQIVVPFGSLPAGAHKLLVVNAATGAIVGWYGVAVLAATGADVNPMEWYLAGGALALGALLVGFGVYLRRRRSSQI